MRKQLAMLLVLLLVAMPVNSLWTPKAQADYVFSGGGDGSPDDPYIILSVEDMDRVRDKPTASYKLGADIDLSAIANWEPIGHFTGTFDGDFHTIRGLTINSSANYVGLFSTVNGTPSIPSPLILMNVRLEDVNITTSGLHAQAGGLAGAIADHARVEGIFVSGTIKGSGSTAGGIVGQLRNRLSFSEAHVEIDGSYQYAGGLAGSTGGGAVIEQSYATGDVRTSGEKAGGLIGEVYSSTQVINSYAGGNVTLLDDGFPYISHGAGGLLGSVFNTVTLTNSYARGNVDTDRGRAGGLVGVRTESANIVVNNTYWNGANASMTTIGGEVSRSGAVEEDDMLVWNTFDGWSGEIWGIREGEGFPYLKYFAPAAPVLTSPSDGAVLNDATPAISGTAEPHSTVTIVVDGVDAGTAPVGSGGDWTWTPSTALAEGSRTVQARAADATGNVGEDSAVITFTVDVTAPVITLQGGASIVILTGEPFVDPGATAEDSRDGDVSVTVAGHVDHSTPGTYELIYSAEDSAGNAAEGVVRTVTVNARSVPVYVSNNAVLKQLVVTVDGIERKLTPLFAAGTTNYSLDLDVDKVDIGAIPAHGGAIVMLNGERITDSGIRTFDLAEGDNLIEIKVTAENGNVNLYRLIITRLADAEQPPTVIEPTGCTFRDIAGHWGEASICEAAAHGLVNGDDAEWFRPQRGVTRIEFAAMLLRALGITSEGESAQAFVDADLIPDWANNVASAAVNAGVMEGYPDSTLRPLQPVSRAEMAVMMARAVEWSNDSDAIASFADDADIPGWAKGAIYTAAQHGLLLGRGDNQFVPSGLATRAEAAVTILRLWHMFQ